MPFFNLLPMLVNSAFTIMGASQQQKVLKANAAWQRYESQLNFEYEKQKRLTAQIDLLKEQRAAGAASGVVVGTGSSLLAMQADMEEFENDMWFLEKGVWAETKARDAELAGQIASTVYDAGTSLFGSYTTYKNQEQLMNFAKTSGSGQYAASYDNTVMGITPQGGGIF